MTEKERILKLIESGLSMVAIARALNMGRNTLIRRYEEYKIKRPGKTGRPRKDSAVDKTILAHLLKDAE